MKRISYVLVGLALSACLFVSCGEQKRKDGRTDTNSSGAISFASDESFSPIVDELKSVFEMSCPDAKVTPIYTSEVDGVNMLLKNKVMLTITARKFSQKEYDYLKGTDQLPEAVPVAYDGMALICNNKNLDSCITVNDVSFCVDSILGGKTIDNPNIFAAKNSKDVIEYVARTPNAIGIIGSNWLNDKRDSTNTTWNKSITVMSVSKLDKATPMNSWKPYQAWLLNGRYPFVRTIYALLNDPKRGLPWGFAHFIESPRGQLIIFKSGLLPTRGEIAIRDVNVNNKPR